jgi:hypothetical protein
MSWKLSVCEPIPRFDRGKNYITTFYSGHTAGGTTLVINDYQIAKFFLPGDILTLGPSTAAGYEGATERVVIVSATTFVVTMLAATSNSYSAGDNISGVASGSSDGWSIISGITSDAIFTPMGWGHIRRSDLSGKQGQPAPSFGNQAPVFRIA